ncbi:MAG: hypothetical protein EOP06_13465 [Proteobacteria bacterium]|nr:MAG: hypothetical protein EOP06_13465 [Pseudomonadota bacterium]
MTKKTQIKQKITKQQIIIASVVVAAALVMIGAIVGVRLFLQSQGEVASPEVREQVEKSIKIEEDKAIVRDQAQAEIEKGDIAKAGDVYKKKIDGEEDVVQKIQLYIDLANTYYGAGKVDAAIAAAQQASDLSSDKFLAADWLSRAYESKGEYSTAIRYYEIAGNSVASPQNDFMFDKAYYDRQIARVKKLQGAS